MEVKESKKNGVCALVFGSLDPHNGVSKIRLRTPKGELVKIGVGHQPLPIRQLMA